MGQRVKNKLFSLNFALPYKNSCSCSLYIFPSHVFHLRFAIKQQYCSLPVLYAGECLETTTFLPVGDGVAEQGSWEGKRPLLADCGQGSGPSRWSPHTIPRFPLWSRFNILFDRISCFLSKIKQSGFLVFWFKLRMVLPKISCKFSFVVGIVPCTEWLFLAVVRWQQVSLDSWSLFTEHCTACCRFYWHFHTCIYYT